MNTTINTHSIMLETNETIMKIEIQLHSGNDVDTWKQMAWNAAKASAEKQNFDLRNAMMVVILPQPGVWMTKGPGHMILVTHWKH